MSALRVGDHVSFSTIQSRRYGVVTDIVGPLIEVDDGQRKRLLPLVAVTFYAPARASK